jgi:hypothetical protein
MSTGADPYKFCIQCRCIKLRADFHSVPTANFRIRKHVCEVLLQQVFRTEKGRFFAFNLPTVKRLDSL